MPKTNMIQSSHLKRCIILLAQRIHILEEKFNTRIQIWFNPFCSVYHKLFLNWTHITDSWETLPNILRQFFHKANIFFSLAVFFIARNVYSIATMTLSADMGDSWGDNYRRKLTTTMEFTPTRNKDFHIQNQNQETEQTPREEGCSVLGH